MPDLSARATGPEIMDDLHVSGPDLDQALIELDGINYLLGGNYVTLNAVTHVLGKGSGPVKYRIADLGCGSGDILRRIRSLMNKRNIDASLTGFDANPNVIKFAVAKTPATCRIQFEAVNIFSEEFRSRRFDVVTATLFFHHFTNNELIGFFNGLKEQVSLAMIINDIHRHWFAYHAIKWLTRIFSRSEMVKHDAAVSVARAFTKAELKNILRQAGLRKYRIKWCWAFRWQVIVWF
jgi:2-polyprenyl-3-methyl-5-hydroxy-6-metoxy-1,4-benzoquinol methylase